MEKDNCQANVIVLGIETATAVCSVGIVRDGAFAGETSLNIPFLHAEWIFPRIEELLRDCNIEPEELDGVAVSIGPGSFTGLRVGLSAAKGIAAGLGCSLTAVPTLEILAFQAQGNNEDMWAVMPSIRGEVFACSFSKIGDKIERTGEDSILGADEIFRMIRPGALLIGLIPSEIRKAVQEKFGDEVAVYSSEGLFRGTIVAMLGAEKLRSGEASDFARLEPKYLRLFPDKSKH